MDLTINFILSFMITGRRNFFDHKGKIIIVNLWNEN